MGGDYEKSMFQQLEKALLKIDDLSEKVQRIESETENRFLKIIYEKDAEIARLKAEDIVLTEKVAKLEAEIDRLRKQLGHGSSNSSTPPSKDTKPNKPNAYNGRGKTANRSGGQKGHKGSSLDKAAIEEKIRNGEASHEIKGHGKPCGEFISKYIVDMKTQTVVTEHRFYADSNGKIQIPLPYRPDVQYGSRLKTFVTTLAGFGLVSSNRIVTFIRSLTSGLISLSDGTVYRFLSEFQTRSAAAIGQIKTSLLNAPVMHVDETGARCDGKNMFFRNYSNEKCVLYTFNPAKGKKAIEDDGILPRYIGTLAHDHYTVNYNYGFAHAECNVHIIRYLRANSENTHNTWSDDMTSLLLSIKRSKQLAMSFGMAGFEGEDFEEYEKRYRQIIADGFRSLENTKSRTYRADEKRLLKRLKKYMDNHLLFARDFVAPFDNNLSERDIRMVKTKMKVSGCFRSLEGGRTFATLMSVVKTAIKQNRSPFSVINDLFAGVSAIG